jgi:hypothetical protein
MVISAIFHSLFVLITSLVCCHFPFSIPPPPPPPARCLWMLALAAGVGSFCEMVVAPIDQVGNRLKRHAMVNGWLRRTPAKIQLLLAIQA